MASPSQRLINAGTVAALEFVIQKCEEKRRTVDSRVTRDEGFRGALAWVVGVCCEEINHIRDRGVVL